MNRIHLVLLWHMHQPQYRDPSSGRYVLPWTRLHALKDYWGMVRVLREFPGVHATFNVVPSLGVQLEEYARGTFSEPWFDLAFSPTAALEEEGKAEILIRAFQVNRETLMRRWPRYVELFDRARSSTESAGTSASAIPFAARDWRDLQVLSQLAWMDEEWLAHDPEVSRLAKQGTDFSEEDKAVLRAKQLELLAQVLPEYRRAAAEGQIEISTTPYYHPILPLLCDSEIARVSNPSTPTPQPPFRHPEDAREQLERARRFHERVFGAAPAGLWPSEGSVSEQTLSLASEVGFRWFATDEGVLGHTLGVGFGRDAAGVPANAERLYSPLRVQLGGSANGSEITGFFRDHYLSDLIGFVYSRMGAVAAAEDLHRRLRAIGERVNPGRPLTVSIILDGENAWEYYPGAGREFLRELYRRIENDPDIRALTASEALAEAGEIPAAGHIFPASWINANFDVWMGHAEDVKAWELLRDARGFYGRAVELCEKALSDAPSAPQLAAAYESILAAEGSDWCWWYGPEHSTPNDAEFDALYRKHLTEVYLQLGEEAPDELAEPIKRQPERAVVSAPASFLRVQVDGRETSYFEWLGAGLYSVDRSGTAMHGRVHALHGLSYGFDENFFYLRVDPFEEARHELGDADVRITLRNGEEVRVVIQIEKGSLTNYLVETKDVCLLGPDDMVRVAFQRILEVGIARRLFAVESRQSMSLSVALWQGGLPIDVLPTEGFLEIKLGEENFAWPG
jgi:alpha-amylase/alpha-mannosidase (GH57 family)